MGAQALLEAEEAVDDPLRMARSLPAGKATGGIVNAVDREHREVVTTNRARQRAAGRVIRAGGADVQAAGARRMPRSTLDSSRLP